jgi:hypothetical protein
VSLFDLQNGARSIPVLNLVDTQALEDIHFLHLCADVQSRVPETPTESSRPYPPQLGALKQLPKPLPPVPGSLYYQ